MESLCTYINPESKLGFALCYENNQIIEKFSSENNIELKLAKEYFTELKKFLFLCSISEDKLAPSSEIDKIWHTFILFTREYRFYCMNFLGKFIDHTPSMEKNQSEENYLKNTLDKYEELFGCFSLNDDVWQVYSRDSKENYSYQSDPNPLCGAGHESKSSDCVFTGNCFSCTSSNNDSEIGENPNNI